MTSQYEVNENKNEKIGNEELAKRRVSSMVEFRHATNLSARSAVQISAGAENSSSFSELNKVLASILFNLGCTV